MLALHEHRRSAEEVAFSAKKVETLRQEDFGVGSMGAIPIRQSRRRSRD
ncbi:MAG: hypothetical protein U1E87_11155 [Alphaproteobacteria bacterium]